MTSLSSAAKAPKAPLAAKVIPQLHDAAQQAAHLRHVLQDGKQRVGCFLGAGCPLGVFDEKGEKSITLIPAVRELTERVAAALTALDKKTSSTCRQWWDTLVKECKGSGTAEPTVEDVLTEVRTLALRKGSADVAGISKSCLSTLDQAICSIIMTEVDKPLPGYRCSYNRFASWVGGLQRLAPVEVFSPNYDLLFEQAFEQHPLPHFDGFVGSREPYFDLASIEHDAIPPRWTRLWKIHGSINWEKSARGGVVRVSGKAAKDKVMIYPSHLKYDQSRRMPYLAMLDQLRAFFRAGPSRDSSTPVLVVCGYSFLDEHLNEVILDGLRGNPCAHCFAMMYGDLAGVSVVTELAERQPNLTVLARDGAVVGTRLGLYRDGTAGDDHSRPWLVEVDRAGSGTAPAGKATRSQLGDFHYFGLFLEQLSGGSSHDTHGSPVS